MKTALDLDGVLANFCHSFIEKANQMGLAEHFPPCWRSVRSWEISPRFDEVWNVIKDDYRFWISLEPMPFSQPLDFWVDCYITARPIDSAVSANWLFLHGYPERPVITVDNPFGKLIHLQERQVELFVDDNVETVKYLRESGINAVLFDSPYHRHLPPFELPTIKSLSEIYEIASAV